MNDYNKNKVKIIMELKGREGVSFIEYCKIPNGKPKILKTENFYRRYGTKKQGEEKR